VPHSKTPRVFSCLEFVAPIQGAIFRTLKSQGLADSTLG